MKRLHGNKPDHAGFDADGSFGYFDRFHVEKNRFQFVVSRLRQERMQQHTALRVDEEGVGKSAEVKVDDWTEHGVDWDVHARHALKLAERNNRQTRGRHHSYNN